MIATVDGRPIRRGQVVGVLLRAHGAAVLEQLIALDAATAQAERHGVRVTDADVDREYDRALSRLTDPLDGVVPGPLDRAEGERLLNGLLAERNISREEYRILIRRNAVLRKIAEAEVTVDEADLAAEFDRAYGERAQVRHIQLATPRAASEVLERLSGGADFAELAGRYSANTASARVGGMLAPFSRGDDIVPEAIRAAAFGLEVGAVSRAVRVGDWYHVLKLEALLPAEDVTVADVRNALEQRVRARKAESVMRALFDDLLERAKIEIHDADLRAAYEARRSAPAGTP